MKIPDFTACDKIREDRISEFYFNSDEKNPENRIIRLFKSTMLPENPEQLLTHHFRITEMLSNDLALPVDNFNVYDNQVLLTAPEHNYLSLAEIEKQTLTTEKKIQIAINAIQTIEHLHNRGIMHKNINPDSVYWEPVSGEIRMTDFWFASHISREKSGLINLNAPWMYPEYISPEQSGRMNRTLDYRSDFYSLGVVLYIFFSGINPFDAGNPLDTVYRHIAIPPPLLDPKKLSIPPALSAIIAKLLEKNAEQRYQSGEGIRRDLKQCIDRTTKFNSTFIPGQQDNRNIFSIPEKLYGRKHEIRTLIDIFQRAASGSREMVFCTGPSGIGKSSLINEIHKPVIRQHGFFVRGKYDLFKRNIPYNAIVQAFRKLIRTILGEDSQQLAYWKNEIMDAIGHNGSLLNDVIPELVYIIGPQPSVPELPPDQSRNRFNLLIQNFLKPFAKKQHPLTIFLDDLQWLDSSSLSLIELLLTDVELQYFMFIGAYRSNEVKRSHPLNFLLDKLHERGFSWDEISLVALKKDDILTMLKDTLGDETRDMRELGSLVLSKTAGNPFFTREFLGNLHHERYLLYKQGWQWNLEKIHAAEITDNVIVLMADKIKRLPDETWSILKIAACIGCDFNIQLLARLCNETQPSIFHKLKPALDEGIIIMVAEETRFIHDKVGEAAHSLIDKAERERIHHTIARFLLKEEDLHNKLLFNIADQLNQARNLLDGDETEQLILFNIKAGDKARQAAAYAAAADFFAAADAALPENKWESTYKQTLRLKTSRAETEYMATRYQTAELLFQEILRKGKTLSDKIPIFITMIINYENKMLFREAVHLAADVIRQIGIDFIDAEKVTPKDTLREKDRFMRNVGRIGLENISTMPPCQSPLICHAVALGVSVLTPYWNIFPQALSYLLFKTVNLSLENGMCEATPQALAILSSLICSEFHDAETGYALGRCALDLTNRFERSFFTPGTQFTFYVMINYWSNPLREGVAGILEAYYSGLESGNLAWASYCLNHYTMRFLLAGDPLNEVCDRYQEYELAQKMLKQEDADIFFNIPRQAAVLLQSGKGQDGIINGKYFHEGDFSRILLKTENKAGLGLLYTFKLTMLAAYGKYRDTRAISDIENCEECIRANGGQYQPYLGLFILFLSHSQNHHTLSVENQQSNLDKLRALQKEFAGYARVVPANFLHMSATIDAEISRIQGEHWNAVEKFNTAIQAAETARSHYLQAIAHNLCTSFWDAIGRNEYANHHRQQAHTALAAWGIPANTTHSPPEASIQQSRVVDTMRVMDSLDQEAVLRASRAIAGEITMKKLVRTMMRIILKNSGAQRGLLIRTGEGAPSIEAYTIGNKGKVIIPERMLLNEYNSIAKNVVYYVSRTGENVILHDATKDPIFSSDPYIEKNSITSILCTPISLKNRFSTILYLENNLSSGAFTKERVAILHILLAQATISLENARLFDAEKKANSQIKESLHEKNTLLKEIHHRVKNNMQVISSLLNLQAGKIKNPKDRALFEESQRRVKAMSLVHEKLYKSDNFTSIEFCGYIDDLIQYLSFGSGHPIKKISIVKKCIKTTISIEQAIPCALIIQELISNALEHAFPDRETGTITIGMHQAGKNIHIYVEDNGIGLEKSSDKHATSFGLKLVSLLTEQLKGTLAISNEGGSQFHIRFEKK